MHGHFRLQNGGHGVQLVGHGFGGHELVDLSEPGQELVLHFVIFQQLADQSIANLLLASTRFLQITGRTVEAGIEQAVVRIVEDPAPLGAFLLQLVEADVAGVGVAEEHLEGHVVEVVIYVYIIQNVLQVVGVGAGGRFLHTIHQRLVLLVAAVENLTGTGAAAFQNVHLIGFVKRKSFVLGNEEAVDPLPHVVMAPVCAVQINHHRIPCLMDDRGGIVRLFVKAVDQPALQAVVQPRPDAVVAGIPQHKALVLSVFPIGEQLGVKILFTVFGLGAELEGLLRHVQTVLALQLELHVLIQKLIVFLVVVFHMAGLRSKLLLHGPVYGVLEGNAVGFVNVVADGQHASLRVPQHIRVCHQTDDGERVVQVHQIGVGNDLAGLQKTAGVEGTGPKHHSAVDLKGVAFIVARGVFFRRNGAVHGVIDHGVLGNGNAQGQSAFIFAAAFGERRIACVAIVARSVGLAGGRGIVIIETAIAGGAAIAVVGRNQAQRNSIQHFAGGIAEGDGLAASPSDFEIGVIFGVGGQSTFAVAVNDQVFAGADGGPLRKLPPPGPFQRVAQTVIGQIDGGAAGVIELDKIHRRPGGPQGDSVVGGQHLADDDPRWIVSADQLIRLCLTVGVVALAGCGQNELHQIAAGITADGVICRHVFDGDAIQQTTARVAENQRFPFGADFEIRVRNTVLLHFVLAAAVDQIIAARWNGRSLREAPLHGLVFLVAQVIAAEPDGLIGIVFQFQPVGHIAVLVGNAHLGIRAYLVDDQRARLHGVGGTIGQKARFGIFIARAVIIRHFIVAGAVLIHRSQNVAGIRRQGGNGDLIDQIHIRVVQRQMRAARRNLEFSVEGLCGIVLLPAIGRIHDHPFASLQRIGGEREGNTVAAVGDHYAFHVDVMVRTVIDLQPVWKVAVFIRYGGIVGAHYLTDDQPLVLGVAYMPACLLGKDHIHQRQQCHEDQQKRQIRQLFILALFWSVVPRGAAFWLSRGVILHAQGLLSFLYDSQSSPT